MDSDDHKINIYSVGIIYLSVCVPSDMDKSKVAEAVNRLHPAGTTNGWVLSEDAKFHTGGPNPCPCDQDKNRMHYLFNC